MRQMNTEIINQRMRRDPPAYEVKLYDSVWWMILNISLDSCSPRYLPAVPQAPKESGAYLRSIVGKRSKVLTSYGDTYEVQSAVATPAICVWLFLCRSGLNVSHSIRSVHGY